MPPVVGAEELCDLLAQEPAGFATDFDGTISPIVSPPEAAAPLPGVEAALRDLTDCLAVVALVSGRTVADLALRVDVPGATYVGNHGVEWWQNPREAGGMREHPTHLAATPSAEESLLLEAAAVGLRTRLAPLVGVRIEDKGLALAVHYRDAPRTEPARELILDACRVLAGDRLHVREGKLVLELVLPRGADKGTALERIAGEYGLRSVAFLGDDLTDRDGFAAMWRLRAAGLRTLAIAVTGPETQASVLEAADAIVEGPSGAAALIAELARSLRLSERAVPT